MTASPSPPPQRRAGRRRASGQARDGERFLELYGRYRGVVREELEAAGLSAEASERLVGTVFERLCALAEAEGPPDPVVTTIRALAREASATAAAPRTPSGQIPPMGLGRVSGG